MELSDTIKKDLEKATHKEVHFYLMGFMQCQNEMPLIDNYLECQEVLTKVANEINKHRNYIGDHKENKK